jgi:hypothetical protein
VAEPLPRPFGPYLLLKRLGQGAMGDAHLARPLDPHRGIPSPVVVKRLHGELASNATFVQRFKHEAEIAVNVDTPHVAKVYDAGAVGETLYIAMEYVQGWPLSKFLEEVIGSKRHATVGSVVDLIVGGLDGLSALHTAVDRSGRPLGVVHRDISPKNLMVGEDGRMRIIDLGLGKSNVQDWKTRTGVVMGSVGYMPPEQVRGQRVDARADLYAMGVVLYEMLTLRSFIRRGPVPTMLSASLTPELRAPSSLRQDLPRGLDPVVLRALDPRPEGRYATAAEFRDALRRAWPEAKSAGGMLSLIDELFGLGELTQRQAEIDGLLALPAPSQGPDDDRTVVFVERTGVGPVRPMGPADERTAVARTRAVESPFAPTVARGAYRPTTEPGVVAALAPPVSAVSGLPVPRRGVPVSVMVAGMAGMLVLGVALGQLVLRRDAELAPVELKPRAVETESLRVTPARRPPEPPPPEPTAAPAVAETPEPAEAGRPRTPRRSRPPRVEPRPSEPAPPAPVAPTAEGNRATATALLARAGKLRARLPEDDPGRSAVDALRTKISLEMSSSNVERVAERLRSFAGELAALERAAP